MTAFERADSSHSLNYSNHNDYQPESFSCSHTDDDIQAQVCELEKAWDYNDLSMSLPLESTQSPNGDKKAGEENLTCTYYDTKSKLSKCNPHVNFIIEENTEVKNDQNCNFKYKSCSNSSQYSSSQNSQKKSILNIIPKSVSKLFVFKSYSSSTDQKSDYHSEYDLYSQLSYGNTSTVSGSTNNSHTQNIRNGHHSTEKLYGTNNNENTFFTNHEKFASDELVPSINDEVHGDQESVNQSTTSHRFHRTYSCLSMLSDSDTSNHSKNSCKLTRNTDYYNACFDYKPTALTAVPPTQDDHESVRTDSVIESEEPKATNTTSHQFIKLFHSSELWASKSIRNRQYQHCQSQATENIPTLKVFT